MANNIFFITCQSLRLAGNRTPPFVCFSLRSGSTPPNKQLRYHLRYLTKNTDLFHNGSVQLLHEIGYNANLSIASSFKTESSFCASLIFLLSSAPRTSKNRSFAFSDISSKDMATSPHLAIKY